MVGKVSADHPQALRACAVRWGELDIAEPIFAAIAAGQLDAWVFRPQSATDEEFHLAITELLDEWASRGGSAYEAVQLIGERWSPRSTELRDIFVRNHVPTGFYDAASPRGQELLAALGLTDPELPVVVLRFRPNQPVLTNPNAIQIAAAFGLLDSLAERAAVRRGGDRGRAGRLERGGVRGVGGAAHRGARTAGHGWPGRQQLTDPQLPRVPAGHQRQPVGGQRLPAGLVLRGDVPLVTIRRRHLGAKATCGCSGCRTASTVRSRTVVVATGAEWRRLGVDNLEALQGRGVFYGAAVTEARAMTGKDVFVLGGGNSAGQAAIYLSRFARQVTILVRRPSLVETMSTYLITEIDSVPNISVRTRVSVVDGSGAVGLERLVLEDLTGRLAGDRASRCAVRDDRVGAAHRLARRGCPPGPLGLHPHRLGPAGGERARPTAGAR